MPVNQTPEKHFEREFKAESKFAPTRALCELDFAHLERHKVLALGRSRGHLGHLPENLLKLADQRLLENMRRETVIKSFLWMLAPKLVGTNVGILKGPALWERLYRPGERESSDLDLFVPPTDLQKLLQALAEIGFRPRPQDDSPLSGFKILCMNPNAGDLTIEVHQRLWWRESPGFKWRWTPAKIEPFVKLEPEDQFIHLAGHWIAQHSMISLHWLFDLVLFLEHYNLDWKQVEARAASIKLEKSVSLARAIAEHISTYGSFSGLNEKGITGKFLIDPKAEKLRYFWNKHRSQDSLFDAVLYDFHWLTDRLKANLRRSDMGT